MKPKPGRRTRAPRPRRGAAARRKVGTVAGPAEAYRARAPDSGGQAVGASGATPDQDVVDELDQVLGVGHEAASEVRSSEEALWDRDRAHRDLERSAADQDEASAGRCYQGST